MSIYPRTEYEMTEDDLKQILDACRPVPMIMVGNYLPSSPQENANRAWAALGRKMGFDHMTVRPAQRGDRFFTAIPSETPEQRERREAREKEEARTKEAVEIRAQISALQDKLTRIEAQAPPGREVGG